MGPRDQKPQYGVPVNPWTGFPITEGQQILLDQLKEVSAELARILHAIDGSDAQGSSFSTRRTAHAGTQLETAYLFAMRELLDR